MNAAEIGRYMRRLIDDPGVVGFPYSVQAEMLAVAYEEFRQYAPDEVWEVSYSPPAITAALAVDLDGKIFGAPPAAWVTLTAYAVGDTRKNNGYTYRVTVAGNSGAAPGPTGTGSAIVDGTVTWAFLPRAQRLTRVVQVDASGQLLSVLQPTNSFESLGQSSWNYGTNSACRWWLDGKTLRFNTPFTGTVQIWYVPQPSIKWASAIVAPADVYVDDLSQYHDIIALLAAQQYAIKEGQSNNKLDQQLRNRVAKMEEFFAKSRSGQSSRWVQEERW